jgi:DNA-binding PadR family transcriptional regulator
MRVPEITHLQFLVLGLLMEGELPGRKLREDLARHCVKKSGPAFYQLMARLEDAGLVAGRYEQKVIDGQIFKERCYKPSGAGVKAWNRTRDFYAQIVGARQPSLGLTR